MFYSFYLLFKILHFSVAGEICDASNNYIGSGDKVYDNSTMTIELDLKSNEEKKRIIRFIVDDKQQEYYFYNVPLSVEVGVCDILSYLFFSLFFFFYL